MMGCACPCGVVVLELRGEPLAQVYCHCDDCQRAHGAAYVPRAIFPHDAVTIRSGETRTWQNRIRTMVICAACGSHLYGEQDGSPFRGVNASLFPAGRFKPTAHLYCDYAVAPVRDNLPHYRDVPADFGGTGKMISW